MVVALAAKILARLLVVNGAAYMKKFAGKTGGIVIMQHYLRRWWSIPSIWPICFAVLFGQDVASINLNRSFDLFNLLEALNANDQTCVTYPEVFPVLAGMLQSGLRAITEDQTDPDSPVNERDGARNGRLNDALQSNSMPKQSPSMSLMTELASSGESETSIRSSAAPFLQVILNER